MQALLSNMESMFSSPDLQLPSCDVRDVARAHILAAETPTASGRCTSCECIGGFASRCACEAPAAVGSSQSFTGHVGCCQRYIVSQPHVLRTVDVVRELRERFPGIVVPDGAEVPLTINIDSSKVRSNRI